jgi:calcineurin-like phosphoesterase
MVGAEDSVLGRSIEAVLHRFTTGLPQRFTVVDEGVLLCGAVVEFDPETGKALSIQRVQRHAPE